MFRKFTQILIIGAMLLLSITSIVAQVDSSSAQPLPTPTPSRRVQISKNKRTSGVKIDAVINANSTENADQSAERKVADQKAVIEAERKKAADEAEQKTRAEYEKREADLKAELETITKAKDAEIERLQQAAETEKQKISDAAVQEKQALAAQAEAVQKRSAEELENSRQTAEAERQKREKELAALQNQVDAVKAQKDSELAELKSKLETDRAAKEKAEMDVREAQEKADKLEKEKIESERIAAEKTNTDQAKFRREVIELAAKKLHFIDIQNAFSFVPATAVSADEIETALKTAAAQNPRLYNKPTFCDPDFEGEPLNVMLSANPTLGGFLTELSSLYNVNFLPDPEILELPVAGDVKDVPWNYVLRSQLNYLDLEARCTSANTIAILKRSKLQTLQENERKNAPLRTEFIKLKYLQPVVGGQVNVAGRSTSSANPLESLENAITKILKSDGDNRGSISRIPGKNEFIITATDDQLAQIKQVISRADKPSYQVVIYASIVTANENKLRDVGGQFNAIGGTANLNLLGGLSGFGSSTNSGSSSSSSGSTSSSGTTPGSLNPGGVRALGDGFSSAPSGGSTFGISNIFGTIQLSAQLSLLQQQGVVKIDNRPSIVVIDGQTADLQIGRQVSIPIQSLNNFGNSPGQLEVLNAGNTLNASPQVIEDENGVPVAVNLNIRVESNDVDTTVVSQGVPSIIRRSTQTSLMLNTNQTAVIGGFSTDSETDSQSKTPGLGDVPVVGGLFKHKIKSKNADRLYFAIRVEVISQGQVLTTIPMNIDTSPRLPNPNNDFFKPYNQPVQQPEVSQPKTVNPPVVKQP